MIPFKSYKKKIRISKFDLKNSFVHCYNIIIVIFKMEITKKINLEGFLYTKSKEKFF